MLIIWGFNFPFLNRTNDQNQLPDSERAGTVCAKQIWHLHRLRSSTDNPPVRQQAYQSRLYWPGASAGYIAPCLCKIITWKWLREEFLGSLNQIISEHLSIVLHFKAVTSYPVALEKPKGADKPHSPPPVYVWFPLTYFECVYSSRLVWFRSLSLWTSNISHRSGQPGWWPPSPLPAAEKGVETSNSETWKFLNAELESCRGSGFLSICYIENSQQFNSRPWRIANALFHHWQLQLSAVCVNKSSESHKRHSGLSGARLIRFVQFTSQQRGRGCYTW